MDLEKLENPAKRHIVLNFVYSMFLVNKGTVI